MRLLRSASPPDAAIRAGSALAALLIALACRTAGDRSPELLPDRAAALLTDPVFTPPTFCRDAERIDRFDWLPDDLPLPPDTIPVRELPPSADGPLVRAGLFVTPGSIAEFIAFAAASWSGRGWKPGWAERETDEAEGTYTAGDRFAAFRLGTCRGGGSALLIVIGETR